MPRKLDSRRSDELLDGVMRVISERGFAGVKMAELAKELNCSVASLYAIAPSKESLVLLAIDRWGRWALADIESCAAAEASASDRARCYFRGGAEKLRPLSSTFRLDVERFDSVRLLWRTSIADRFIDRFVELVELACAAGEVRPVNTRFLGEVLRKIAFVTRDEHALSAAGISSEQAVLEVDRMVWEGIRAD